MIFKNPEENEQRRYNYHNTPLSAVNEREIEQHCVREHFQKFNESEWRQEYIPKVREALKSLSYKQYQVIILHVCQNLEQAEVARLMNCSQQAVSGLYNRAIENIRIYIAK